MQRNCWRIKCNHTPETLDRILAPFRKRGMTVESVNYKRESDFLAACIIEFDEDNENSERIFKNLIRTYDIESIEIVSVEKAVVSSNGNSL
jgi:acetolactate synthase regulatory subunit